MRLGVSVKSLTCWQKGLWGWGEVVLGGGQEKFETKGKTRLEQTSLLPKVHREVTIGQTLSVLTGAGGFSSSAQQPRGRSQEAGEIQGLGLLQETQQPRNGR